MLKLSIVPYVTRHHILLLYDFRLNSYLVKSVKIPNVSALCQ